MARKFWKYFHKAAASAAFRFFAFDFDFCLPLNQQLGSPLSCRSSAFYIYVCMCIGGGVMLCTLKSASYVLIIVPHLSGAAPALHPLKKPALHGRQLIQRQAIRQQR